MVAAAAILTKSVTPVIQIVCKLSMLPVFTYHQAVWAYAHSKWICIWFWLGRNKDTCISFKNSYQAVCFMWPVIHRCGVTLHVISVNYLQYRSRETWLFLSALSSFARSAGLKKCSNATQSFVLQHIHQGMALIAVTSLGNPFLIFISTWP